MVTEFVSEFWRNYQSSYNTASAETIGFRRFLLVATIAVGAIDGITAVLQQHSIGWDIGTGILGFGTVASRYTPLKEAWTQTRNDAAKRRSGNRRRTL